MRVALLYVGSSDLNSDPNLYVAGALPAEPFLWPTDDVLFVYIYTAEAGILRKY